MFDWFLNLFRRKDAAAWAADARDLLAKGKAARALSPAEKAVGMAPADVDMLLLRSEVLRAADMPERALEDLLAALAKEPGRAAANLAVLEKLEPSAPNPELVWLQAWKVHAEKEALDRASELVRKIAGRGEAAVGALREQCKKMLSGGGDRRGALVALAVLAVERGETKDAVARVLEMKAAGGRPALFMSEGLLRGVLNRGKDAPGALRALVAVRVLLGKEAEAREAALELCRRDPAAGAVLVEELLEDEKKVAAFAMGLVAILEAEGMVTVRVSLRLAEALLKDGRTADAAAVLLRTVGAEPAAAEQILPLATKVLKAGGGLDAQDAHARAAALAGDHVSAILTAQEFVETEPRRALDVLALLPPAARDRDDGALLGARAKAALGDHDRAAPDLRRWSLGGGGGRAKEALPSVAAVARAHPDVPAYALLHHDLLQFTGDVEGAAKVLLDLVGRSPAQAEAVEARAVSLLKQAPGSYAAGLAAARAGLVRASDPGAVLGRLRAALESSPGREAEVLECLEGARKWTGGIEPVELFHGEMVLRTGNVDRGLAMLEEVVVRNAGRGPEALAVLRAFQQGPGAQDPRAFLSEHRIRRALKDWEACIVPLRKVADLDEARREEVLAAADAVIAEAPACRGAHRTGVDIAMRLEQAEDRVLGRLAALLDIPTPPRDTEFVTRRAGAVQAKKPTVAGHRLLVRCHLYASRWPLVLEEVRRLVEADPGTRGEAVNFLGHVISHEPGDLPARFLLASLHAALGSVDAARESLAGALPRTEEVFDAHRRLIQAYPTHPGVRLDLVDALVAERRLDEALEEAAHVHGLPGAPAGEVVRRVEKILELSPEYAPALYALADAHHAASEWAPEIAACRRILRIAPREAETILQRLDAVLDRDPRCGEAALEIVRIASLHQKLDRVAPEGRRALDCAANPAEVAAVADALRAHERALGSDAPYREVLAQALTRAGRAKPAVAAWNRLLEAAPDRAPGSIRDLERLCAAEGKDGGEALRTLALARLLAGDPAEAAEAVDRLLAREPDAVEDGRALFRRILAAHPSSHDAAAGVAKTSVQAGDADGAVEAWLHDLRQHPDRRREIGMALGGLREKFPGAASVPLALAEFIHLPLGLLEETADALTAALAVDPACHGSALLLAEQVLARDGKSPAGTAARARALTAAARYDDAVAGFRALAELDPRHREDALAGLDSVLEGGPGHPEAQYRRSEILLELGRAKESAEQATALLEALAPKDPRGFRALLLLAGAREAQEDFDGGLEALRRAGAEHPGETSVPPRVRANFAARLAARAAEAGKHGGAAGKPGVLDAAEAILDGGDPATALTAVGPEPEKGEALARWKTIRGRAFFVLGKPAEAVVELEEALKAKGMEEAKSEASRDALYFCGLSQLRVGEMLKAIRRLEQAARVAPEHRRVREAVDRVYEDDRRRLERPLSFTQDLETLRRGTADA